MAHHYYHHQARATPALAPLHNLPYTHVAHAAPAPSPIPKSRHHRATAVAAAPAPAPAPAPARKKHVAAAAVLDPILAYHTDDSIEFDVSLSPTHIMIARPTQTSMSFINPSSRHLTAPAVVPPQPFLRITCALLRWPIDVRPASHSGIVTVGDVLSAIYHELRQLVQGSDWHSASPQAQESIRNAYHRRCRRHPQAERRHEEARGLRRVDWLMKNTMFQGLRPGKSPDHWEMHVRPGEKSVKFALGA